MHDVEIILPCYNPHREWAQGILEKIKAFECRHPTLSIGVIVINDGSTIGFSTEELLFINTHLPNCKVYSYTKNKGKGHAVRYGIERSKAPYLMYTDIDFPFELSSMQNMLDTLISGADIVIGHRQKCYDHQLSSFRKLLSMGSHFYNKVLLRLPYTDTQGGLKCFNATGKEIMMQTKINRYLFDTEFLLLASKRPGLKIVELPIETVPNIHLRPMGISTLKKEFLGITRLFYIKLFK